MSFKGSNNINFRFEPLSFFNLCVVHSLIDIVLKLFLLLILFLFYLFSPLFPFLAQRNLITTV